MLNSTLRTYKKDFSPTTGVKSAVPNQKQDSTFFPLGAIFREVYDCLSVVVIVVSIVITPIGVTVDKIFGSYYAYRHNKALLCLLA